MTEEQFNAVGGNTSKDHIDFMIGSDKLIVEGICQNERSEVIMKNGEWAFEV
jgi:aminopeptidase